MIPMREYDFNTQHIEFKQSENKTRDEIMAHVWEQQTASGLRY